MNRALLRKSLILAFLTAILLPSAYLLYDRNLIPGCRHVRILETPPKKAPRLERNLTRAQRVRNFELLWQAIDRWYGCFLIKQIDCNEVHCRYRPLAENAAGDEFYLTLTHMIRELRDSHSYPINYDDPAALDWAAPAIEVRRIEGRAVVARVITTSDAAAQGVRPGSVIADVDGVPVAEKIEELRSRLPVRSSERAFLDAAHKRLLSGENGTTVTMRFVPPGGSLQTATLIRSKNRELLTPARPGFPTAGDETIWFGRTPSGVGYLRLVAFHGRERLAAKFDEALERLRDAPGLIVDIRDNPGGYGTRQPQMIGRFLTARRDFCRLFRRNGPAHDAFEEKQSGFVLPSGPWTYTRPVALLLNEGAGSAADLFAASFIGTGRPITIGATTHGNLAGDGVNIVLPCGFAARISDGYVADAAGRIIEVNGNDPQIKAELTIADIINGRDSVIDRACEEILTQAELQRTATVVARPAAR